MTLPAAENIPELDFNYEGLWRHSLLSIFVQETEISEHGRKIRSWLLHSLVSSARHYSSARKLVVLQNNADQEKDGGAIFYILDFSEQIQDCISSTYRACMVIKQMGNSDQKFNAFLERHNTELLKLNKIRNQFEHMYTQIVSGEIGSGPILITLSDSGKLLKFRSLQLEIYSLHGLIKGLYEIIAGLYQNFDAESKPQTGGPVKLTVTATATVINSSE